MLENSCFFCPYINRRTPVNNVCNAMWDYTTVRRIALLTADEQKYFEEKISTNFLLKAKGVQECPQCHSYCERKNTNNRRVICPYCTKQAANVLYEFCWYCLHEWKLGSSITKCGNESCSGVDPRLTILQKAALKEVVGVQNVPSIRACGKCGLLIEHVKACKHMKCLCGHEFCFICLKSKTKTGWVCGTFNSSCTPARAQTQIVGT